MFCVYNEYIMQEKTNFILQIVLTFPEFEFRAQAQELHFHWKMLTVMLTNQENFLNA